jgi:hypothetical protein
MSRVLAAVATALFLLSLLLGCREAPEQKPLGSRAGDRQSAPLPLVARKDIADQPEGSPRATVMELWFWAQTGSSGDVVEMYAPAVRRLLGVGLISSAYAYRRPIFLVTNPKVVAVTEGSAGTVVLIDVQSRGSAPSRESFVLRRRDAEWEVVYDTILDKALIAYIQRSEGGAPTGKPIPRRAAITAEAAARRYRLYASELGLHNQTQPKPDAVDGGEG